MLNIIKTKLTEVVTKSVNDTGAVNPQVSELIAQKVVKELLPFIPLSNLDDNELLANNPVQEVTAALPVENPTKLVSDNNVLNTVTGALGGNLGTSALPGTEVLTAPEAIGSNPVGAVTGAVGSNPVDVVNGALGGNLGTSALPGTEVLTAPLEAAAPIKEILGGNVDTSALPGTEVLAPIQEILGGNLGTAALPVDLGTLTEVVDGNLDTSALPGTEVLAPIQEILGGNVDKSALPDLGAVAPEAVVETIKATLGENVGTSALPTDGNPLGAVTGAAGLPDLGAVTGALGENFDTSVLPDLGAVAPEAVVETIKETLGGNVDTSVLPDLGTVTGAAGLPDLGAVTGALGGNLGTAALPNLVAISQVTNLGAGGVTQVLSLVDPATNQTKLLLTIVPVNGEETVGFAKFFMNKNEALNLKISENYQAVLNDLSLQQFALPTDEVLGGLGGLGDEAASAA